MHAHYLFDALAWTLGALAGWYVMRLRRSRQAPFTRNRYPLGYIAALTCGAAIGAFGLGTLNLYLSGVWPALGRSILGGLAGAILFVEIYKKARNIRGSTGGAFVAAFTVGVAVGRIGCFLMGLDDYTYGTATTLPWGVDFGDGVKRHPVQLFESIVMASFGLIWWIALIRDKVWAVRDGFYWCVFVYAGQRFVWEFLKPYQGFDVGGLQINIFHLVTLALCAYAFFMLKTQKRRNG